MKLKSTKKALFMSVIVLLVSMLMMVGTTFAWFTDSVTSSNNIIKSGTLDVKLYYDNDETTEWTEVTSTTNIFKKDTLWEPGHTEVIKLKVVNAGTLALKYKLGINVADEKIGVNRDGDDIKLSNHIKFGVVDGEKDYTNRKEAVAAVDASAKAISEGFNGYSAIDPAINSVKEEIVTLVVYMPTSVGNEVNPVSPEKAPVIKIGLNLVATQLNAESDSFGPDYDKDLSLDTTYVGNEKELQEALAKGGHVTLSGDIKVEGSAVSQTSRLVGILIENVSDAVLDLNGNDIIFEDETRKDSVLIYVINSNLTIKGEGKVFKGGDSNIVDSGILLLSNGDSTVNIEGGSFEIAGEAVLLLANGTNYDATQPYGTINVYGGEFTSSCKKLSDTANVMNHGVGKINYYGGTFNWHPENAVSADDKDHINVAEDYKVVEGNGVYKVVKKELLTVNTVADANAKLANKNTDEIVVLKDCTDTSGIINIPEGSAKLVLDNVNIASINADKDAVIEIVNTANVKALTGNAISANGKLTIKGNGSLVAIANGGVNDDNGGSAITATDIVIDGLASVDAQGWGLWGFGIGGNNAKSINVVNTKITNVQGGYVQPNLVYDTSYGKSEPEGGAAIGSGLCGATIVLDNVVIENAKGGSKAAGIGAKFWTGISITITNSVIKNVEGGNASAGIGGSRVSSEPTASESVYITIIDSTVNATGGEFGAGIGSGYDTHCKAGQPFVTINIKGNSVITAKGGKYGAGIGTGYHNAGLKGAIENTVTVNATAGASRDKYTVAMDVGFGVIDKTREADSSNTSSFNYKGTTITVADAPDV